MGDGGRGVTGMFTQNMFRYTSMHMDGGEGGTRDRSVYSVYVSLAKYKWRGGCLFLQDALCVCVCQGQKWDTREFLCAIGVE